MFFRNAMYVMRTTGSLSLVAGTYPALCALIVHQYQMYTLYMNYRLNIEVYKRTTWFGGFYLE
jgi:hypothetical protein